MAASRSSILLVRGTVKKEISSMIQRALSFMSNLDGRKEPKLPLSMKEMKDLTSFLLILFSSFKRKRRQTLDTNEKEIISSTLTSSL